MSDQKQEIVDQLTERIAQYKLREATILEKAIEEGGVLLVLKMIEEKEALEAARFDLIQRALDTNAAGFEQFAKEAEAEAKALEKDIDKLESIERILGTIANVVNLVGRILIRFGL